MTSLTMGHAARMAEEEDAERRRQSHVGMFTDPEAKRQYLEWDRKRHAYDRDMRDYPQRMRDYEKDVARSKATNGFKVIPPTKPEHPGEIPPAAKKAHNEALDHLARLTEVRWRQSQQAK